MLALALTANDHSRKVRLAAGFQPVVVQLALWDDAGFMRFGRSTSIVDSAVVPRRP